MLPDRVSNPGPLTYKSGALPIALRGRPKLKGPPKTLRDVRTSTYQIFRFEENTNLTTKFHK